MKKISWFLFGIVLMVAVITSCSSPTETPSTSVDTTLIVKDTISVTIDTVTKPLPVK